MISPLKLPPIVLVAVLGHSMALFWVCAAHFHLKICENTIYAIPISQEQIRRELRNSLHTPIHAAMLYVLVLLNCFTNDTWGSFGISVLLTTVWAESWHYISHRAFHLPRFHWIHIEHHKSLLSSPFTALSFSFTEKLIFNLGILGTLAIVDQFYRLNFFGIAMWYVGYLVINSFSHANFEVKSKTFQKVAGKVLTSTTYHALHHSRYSGNFGLGTRLFDRVFHTEWADYETVFGRITGQREPLTRLGERMERAA
jgi:sterol desaturase/sphingolipid hydroxylase (fatty acid hydroxylase superfamily)